MATSFDLHPTPAGPLLLAWGPAGLARITLPGPTPDTLVRRLVTELPDATPAGRVPRWVASVGARVAAHLGGTPAGYDDVPLDTSGCPAFHQEVYARLRQVAAGEVTSYGRLAAAAGRPAAARAVGTAMARNPWPVVVPCHRVLAGGGRPGGYSGGGGLATKRRLLAAEGVRLAPVPGGGYRTTDLAWDAGAALRHLGRDPGMRRMLLRGGPYTPGLAAHLSPWQALSRSIIYQQLAGAAARTIHGRVAALGRAGFPTPDALLELSEARLREAGLSRNKLAALQDLARHVLDGTIPTRAAMLAMDDETIIERVTVVRGIGRWTVEMLLMFHLGRPDVLPLGDYGVRKGAGVGLGLAGTPGPDELARLGERWAPWRSVASWYCWRALE